MFFVDKIDLSTKKLAYEFEIFIFKVICTKSSEVAAYHQTYEIFFAFSSDLNLNTRNNIVNFPLF